MPLGPSCSAAESSPPACKYGQLTTSAFIIIENNLETGEGYLSGLELVLVGQAECVVVLAEPCQQVSDKKTELLKC